MAGPHVAIAPHRDRRLRERLTSRNLAKPVNNGPLTLLPGSPVDGNLQCDEPDSVYIAMIWLIGKRPDV